MKKRYGFFILTLVFSLVACANKSEKMDDPNQNKVSVSLELEQNQFSYENWKMDSSHQKLVKGKLLAGEKPVEDAVIQVSNKRKTSTNSNGEFSLLLDTNIIERDIVHVSSLDQATVDGESLSKQTKKDLLSLEQELVVYFPIEIERVERTHEDARLVDVYAHAVLQEDEEFPKFGVEKFPIIGTIKDANGNPVEGATVNIRRDGVEGFSMSEPSNQNGEYAMYYIPEDDENHYLNVYLPEKKITYTLPNDKAFLFPDDFGIQLDIVLPEQGTIIQDAPPTLVATSTQGALYKGVLIGVNMPNNEAYSITVPERDGSFVVTLPKEAWEQNPSFYQINYRGYSEQDINLGDVLSSEFLPQPERDEPNNIKVSQE